MLSSRTPKSFCRACRVFQRFDFFYHTREYGNWNHLSDLISGFQFHWGVAQICHEHENFAAIARVDDTARGCNAACRHGRPITNQ